VHSGDGTTAWWKSFFAEDVTTGTFNDEQNALFETYEVSQDQKRIFHSIRTGKNLFLPDISDEELIWNIGVMGVGNSHRGDYRFYRKSVLERLQKHDEAERLYKWRSGTWTKPLMKRLVQNYSVGQLVVVPDIKTSDGNPMIFVHEWYEHWPCREEQGDDFFAENIRAYALMARSICRAYPAATMKGLVSFADMHEFDWEKYDMEQKMRHSNLQAVIPNKLKKMISVRPDDRMKKQLEDYGPVMKRYGYVVYDTFDEAISAEASLLPDELPTFVGGTRKVDIRECLRHLFCNEPDALALMEEVYDGMVGSGELLCPRHMQ